MAKKPPKSPPVPPATDLERRVAELEYKWRLTKAISALIGVGLAAIGGYLKKVSADTAALEDQIMSMDSITDVRRHQFTTYLDTSQQTAVTQFGQRLDSVVSTHPLPNIAELGKLDIRALNTLNLTDLSRINLTQLANINLAHVAELSLDRRVTHLRSGRPLSVSGEVGANGMVPLPAGTRTSDWDIAVYPTQLGYQESVAAHNLDNALIHFAASVEPVAGGWRVNRRQSFKDTPTNLRRDITVPMRYLLILR